MSLLLCKVTYSQVKIRTWLTSWRVIIIPTTLSKMIYRVNSLLITIKSGLFSGTFKLIWKFVYPKIAKTILKRRTKLDLLFLISKHTSKLQNQDSVVLHKARHIDQELRVQKLALTFVVHWFLTKVPRQCNVGKHSLFIRWYWITGCSQVKEWSSDPTSHQKLTQNISNYM